MRLNCEETKAKERGKSSWKRVDASVYWRLGNLINATWNSSNGLSLKSIPYRSILFFFFFSSNISIPRWFSQSLSSNDVFPSFSYLYCRMQFSNFNSSNRIKRFEFLSIIFTQFVFVCMYVINEQRKLMENRHFSNIVLSGEAVCSLGFN